MTKKILGLDLGVASIGWALIEEKEENNQRNIIAMGTRLVPLGSDEENEFSTGKSISKNRERANKRTMRRMYDRYQLRRQALVKVLEEHGMFNPELMSLTATQLWGMRARAVTEKVSLEELGRILYHMNQKRGYRNVTKTELTDTEKSEHLTQVRNRHQEIKAAGLTIGQKFYNQLAQNHHYRLKEQVFPREAYIEEYNQIMACQQQYYPEILTNELIQKIRDQIIYYQRPLKSQKGLVSVCELAGFYVKDKNGKEIFTGPKVAPRTSPLFQVCTLWETINNITIKDKFNQPLEISLEQKRKIFDSLNEKPKLTVKELFNNIPELNTDSFKHVNQALKNGIKGNTTRTKLLEVFEKFKLDKSLLEFNLQIIEKPTPTQQVNKQTGEILSTTNKKIISPDFEKEPLYRLWHVIYSIGDKNECAQTLQKQFGIPYEAAQVLAEIDFKTPGFGKKSSKAIRNILPYLMEGYMYSQACELAGYNHSKSLTKDETLQQQLLDKLELLPKNSLRQPVVEKILNQTIRLVNEIIDPQRGWVTPEERHGNRFEIRVELARELKLSKEERKDLTNKIKNNERVNNNAKKRIEELGLKLSRNNIIKVKLFEELSPDKDDKINAMCIYCGNLFGMADAITGNNIDVEHIIPKSLYFDDSLANKTLAHRACNATKGNNTAYDFMKMQGDEKLKHYVNRVNYLFNNKIISPLKRDYLLMSRDKIPQDFINRQLRESQYISRKARQILQKICYTVNTTTGSVTEYLRRIWGYDDILVNLHLPIYREHNLTKTINEEIDGQIHSKEIIPDWTKRNDHRNHALDALIVACTKQGFIQRINTISSENTRDQLFNEVKDLQFKEKLTLLDKYLISQKPFEPHLVQQHVANILVSFKAGKKVATYSTRKIKRNGKKIVVQTKILTPRAALHEEKIYGKIKIIEKDKNLKYLFQNPHLIIDSTIRQKVEERLQQYQNNQKQALQSLKKSPIYIDSNHKIPLQTAHCFKEEYVIKYKLEEIKEKNINDIIDTKVRKLIVERFAQYGNDPKKAFKEPLYLDPEKTIPIKTIRCFTGLSAVAPLRKNADGQATGFVKPGNNHHLAIYADPEGNKIEHICTFWHAVKRKKYGIPIIINDTHTVWNTILNNPNTYPQDFLCNLPPDNLNLLLSMQQNETFLFGLTTEEASNYINERNYAKLSQHLYKVQKLTSGEYFFRLHSDNSKIDKNFNEAKITQKVVRISSIGVLLKHNPIKVCVDMLGQLTLIQNHYDKANSIH